MLFRHKERKSYTVYTYGADVLKKRAAEIKEVTPEIREIAKDMLVSMRLFEGIGLAGPQHGVGQRIVALDVPGPETGMASPGEAMLLQRMPLVVINPEIVAGSNETEAEMEACLSVPGISGPVERPRFIQFRAQTLDGELIECECGGLLARCLQHETDHLDGTLFVDRLTEDDFDSIKLKLKRLKKSGAKKDFKKTIRV